MLDPILYCWLRARTGLLLFEVCCFGLLPSKSVINVIAILRRSTEKLSKCDALYLDVTLTQRVNVKLKSLQWICHKRTTEEGDGRSLLASHLKAWSSFGV